MDLPDGYQEIETILKEIFEQSPLPNKLKKPKSDYGKGRMGYTAKIRIVKEYRPEYGVFVLCKKVQPEEMV